MEIESVWLALWVTLSLFSSMYKIRHTIRAMCSFNRRHGPCGSCDFRFFLLMKSVLLSIFFLGHDLYDWTNT